MAQPAVLIGHGPTFTYTYSPRLALGLDTNAAYAGIAYIRESPTLFNCSYLTPASSATPASGTMTYEFRPDPGYVIQDFVLLQKTAFYTSGNVRGEYSTDNSNTFRPFYITPPYPGSSFNFTKQVRFHHLNATNLIVRYFIARTGSTRSVQFLRDCDDDAFNLAASGLIVSQTNATATRGVSVVAQGSVWKYLDNGSNQGTAWRRLDFDDSTWPSGPAEFGYGERDEATTNQFGPDSSNKYITTYYRHRFVLTNQAPFKKVLLGLLRDDGGVVYLNDREVFRSNLPAGNIGHTTLASSAVDNANETTFFETSLNPTNMLRGTNILAVEIHQQRADSSDVSFDLDLWGELEAERPLLRIERDGDCIILRWEAEDFILERSPDLNGAWETAVEDPASPYSVCGLERQFFFRLRKRVP